LGQVLKAAREEKVMSDEINLAKQYEVRHWMRTLGCTELELYGAVKAVGTRVEDVREYIRSTVPRSSKWDALVGKHRSDDS
jgi:hypothetical protein